MKRSAGRLYDGIWHCVHGKINQNEKAWQTALRELKEETGLKPLSMWTVDIMSSFYEAEQDRVNFVPVFAVEVALGSEPALSEEHCDYKWLNVEEAAEKVAWQTHSQSILTINKMMHSDYTQKKWLEIKID